MLLIELFDALPISIEEMQILESAKMVWVKRKNTIIQKGTKNKKSNGSSKSCETITNITKPQKIVVESFKNGRS